MARPRGTDSAKVIQVIVTKSLCGEGTDEDPCRTVLQYWDFGGNFLTENDPFEKEKPDSVKESGKPDIKGITVDLPPYGILPIKEGSENGDRTGEDQF